MKKAYLMTAIVASLSLAGGYFYTTPHLTALNLQQAVENSDQQAISQLVNFPVLRKNLKVQISDLIANKKTEAESNIFAQITESLTSGVSDFLIDKIVTPEGVIFIIKHGQVKSENNGTHDAAAGGEAVANNEQDLSFQYENLNRFTINIKSADSDITVIITRESILGDWQLTALENWQP